MNTEENYGIQQTIDALKDTLIAYLEMQYHIKDTSLIRERHRLLTQENTVFRPPFVESTPLYKQGQGYQAINIPAAVKDILEKIYKFNVGIYPNPYQHQITALEAFFTEQHDLIIATGTGSGKTESFLMPILGALVLEATERPKSVHLPGCRALLLYPLNALVNDQLARLRKLFGHEDIAKLIAGEQGRLIRFGAYNSRTPYPGPRSSNRDSQYIKPLFEDYYLNPAFLTQKEKLEKLGRWPAKDLEVFYDRDKAEKRSYSSGKRKGETYVAYNWENRLKTQPTDRELLTRHEMQEICPDLLITNYSMLEYMLMRPIERSLFQQTKAWLAADKRNEFILVLDEAHMYRGTSGAEVALLIRRLQARLGIPRERMRCILTSASLGDEKEVQKFAQDLTGLTVQSNRQFKVITGQLEQRREAKKSTIEEAQALADFELKGFNSYYLNQEVAVKSVMQLARQLGWPTHQPDDLHQYLYDNLMGFGPAETLIQETSGQAIELEQLAQHLFPQISPGTQRKATASLLALCTFARRSSDEKVFVPTRLHLFYRGLPGLYVCINPHCEERLDETDNSYLLGRLYTTPRTHCDCGGRVYELLVHSDCGSAFIRGYIQGDSGEFLLHEPSGKVGQETVPELTEVHILVEKVSQPPDSAAAIYVDVITGKFKRDEPSKKNDFLKAYRANKPLEQINGKPQITFDKCPICTRDLKKFRYKLTSFETKGEGAFANLVKAQVINQPPQNQESLDSPNGGRKSLLFSDGRQKAARLALFIPREVELDSFRQAICLAAQYLTVSREVKPTEDLYIAFIAVVRQFNLQFFDLDDQKSLREHIKKFSEHYEAVLKDALEWRVTIPGRYHEALLRQLCHPYYSLQATTIGYVTPSERTEKRLRREIGENPFNVSDIDNIIIVWINDLLRDYAFNKAISDFQRNKAANYPRSWGNPGKFRTSMKKILKDHYKWADSSIEKLETILRDALCESRNGVYFLDPNALCLVIDLKRSWYHCQNCAFISPVTVADHCPQCASKNVSLLSPEDDYIQARKRFWRESVTETLEKRKPPRHITAEEHTAQLSHKDIGTLHATTEKHELQFQDILLDKTAGPIDVLSCTTTMEVGVDIGALTAVGLRNVPPQRENYQQRAGRAGRRGSAVSTVITYAQGGHHDSYYFHNPEKIIAGNPRKSVIDITNEKIAKRHVHAFLFQTFFHAAIDEGKLTASPSLNLFSALGNTQDFFACDSNNLIHFPAFKTWVTQNIIAETGKLRETISRWLPDLKQSKPDWLEQVAQSLLEKLGKIAFKTSDEEALLDFLFNQNLLPRYAFPIDLCSFPIETYNKQGIGIKEHPQQSIAKALSEYAPGRQLIINKETYRCGGITSASAAPDDINKAESLFKNRTLQRYAHCVCCSYVQDTFEDKNSMVLPACPICGGTIESADMLVPEVFRPEGGKAIAEYDREQEFTYASSAQFPIPVDEEKLGKWQQIGVQGQYIHALDRRLVIVNKGKDVGTEAGFEICTLCGASVPANTSLKLGSRHKHPYLVKRNIESCQGEARRVLLGTTFYSDLLLIRILIRPPFNTDMYSSIARNALEDGLRSLAEALLLAASRTLDIDPTEFSAGFRIMPNKQEQAIDADVYLFDTLAGGAGYADQAGQQLNEILEEALRLLENCPGECERSCQDCLRHYANQYWHQHLDRHLAIDLLRYLIKGTSPGEIELTVQRKQLYALKRLLELDNYECVEGASFPLVIKTDHHSLNVGLYPGLLEEKLSEDVFLINDYFIRRNLPGAYQSCLEKARRLG